MSCSRAFVLGGICIIFLAGCVVGLTNQGSLVRPIRESEASNCEYVGIVTGSGAMGASTSHDAEGAMNEVRNKAAKLGANRIRILHANSDIASSTVSAEALACPDSR